MLVISFLHRNQKQRSCLPALQIKPSSPHGIRRSSPILTNSASTVSQSSSADRFSLQSTTIRRSPSSTSQNAVFCPSSTTVDWIVIVALIAWATKDCQRGCHFTNGFAMKFLLLNWLLIINYVIRVYNL